MFKKTVTLTIVLLIILLACDEEPLEVFPDYSSPAQTFWTFTECFDRFYEPDMIKVLDKTLTDEFIYVFDPNDPEDIPFSWNKDKFIQACYNMFIAEILDIDFDYTENDIGNPGNGETLYETTINIRFLLMITEVKGYMVDGEIDVIFEKTTGNWKIRELRDHTASDDILITSIQSTSLGYILTLYE